MANGCGTNGKRGKGRREFLLGTVAIGAALTLPGTARAAEIRELSGGVKVNGKPAKRSTHIRPGDVVETAAGAKVSFVIGDDAFLLREQSKIALERPPVAKSSVITGLRVLTGGLLAVFGKGSKRVETPTATAGIRGTGIYVEAGTTESYLCTCYGEVDLRQRGGEGHKLIVSGYHTATTVYATSVEGRTMVPAELKHHTDQELIALERLVGRTSPLLKHNQRLEGTGQDASGGEVVKQAPAEPAQSPPSESPKAQTATQPPPQQAVSPQPAPQQTAPQPKPQSAAPPEPSPPPRPRPTPPPESKPPDQEWRLPPPRLN
ncbi:MAG: hypothetical protein C5B46_08265 [Proteobacteria bacterium]|nr:MAG: hypothetical protein C5B46_08265 [Pseudomonadota bacterium]